MCVFVCVQYCEETNDVYNSKKKGAAKKIRDAGVKF